MKHRDLSLREKISSKKQANAGRSEQLGKFHRVIMVIGSSGNPLSSKTQ
jgi:hypothetical protein